jgi:beta-fructofuranosidase
MKVNGFRDPAPWREPALYPDGWLMAVGSGTKESGGEVLLYKSADLQNWEFIHVVSGGAKAGASVANPVDSGDMWECPDLFPLGNKHVLIYSTQGKVFWKVGELAGDLRFHEQQSGVLDYGSFYAPKTQLDKSGDRILWGWIPETRPVAEYSASGWAGLMSLPRVLTMGPDGRLRIGVLPAVEKLRQHEQKLRLTPTSAGGKERHSDQHLKDACGELLCVVKPSDEPFTMDLLNAADVQTSFLSIRYSRANPSELVVGQQRLPIHLADGEPLELRFYVDGSVIELFANNQVTSTTRFDYSGATAPEIAVSITGKPSDITRLSLWQLKPISVDRLTT